MTGWDTTVGGEEATQTTRRGAVKLGGGAALAALALAAVGGGARVAAQEASPEASPVAGDGLVGKYFVARIRTANPDWDVDEMMALIQAGFVPLVQEVPGFVAYFGTAGTAPGDHIYVGVYEDKAGADESTRVAGEWLTSNGYDFYIGDPLIIEGVIGVAADSVL